jgi:hypothetical protein
MYKKMSKIGYTGIINTDYLNPYAGVEYNGESSNEISNNGQVSTTPIVIDYNEPNKLKTNYVPIIIGGVVVLGVIGYIYYRNKKPVDKGFSFSR